MLPASGINLIYSVEQLVTRLKIPRVSPKLKFVSRGFLGSRCVDRSLLTDESGCAIERVTGIFKRRQDHGNHFINHSGCFVIGRRADMAIQQELGLCAERNTGDDSDRGADTGFIKRNISQID